MRAFSLLSLPAVVAAAWYCPGNEKDMNNEGGEITFQNGGWSFTGGSRVSSKTAWNMLGGSMEWDMDLSQVHDSINTNFYTSSPNQTNCGKECYCDIQKTSTNPSCMELDLVENNGKCYMATTLHTFATDGQPNNHNCDRWGCGSSLKLSSPTVHIRTVFGMDGSVNVYVNGVLNNNYSPSPSQDSNKVVVSTMSKVGAVIESSQWFGWVPDADKCPSGGSDGLTSSVFTVSNVRVNGTVVQGPIPTPCAAPPPTPPSPPSPPTPPTPPTPTGGKCCFGGCGSGNCQGGWCADSQANCEGNCNGQWC